MFLRIPTNDEDYSPPPSDSKWALKYNFWPEDEITSQYVDS